MTTIAMRRPFGRSYLPYCLLAIGAAPLASSAGEIRWRSGTIATPERSTAEIQQDLAALAGRSEGRHMVVQFGTSVSPQERAKLAAAGLQLLNYLGNDAFFAVAGESPMDPAALSGLNIISSVQAVETDWKLHPALVRGEVPEWAIVAAKSPDEVIVAAYVLFHPDVALEPDAVNLALRHRASVRSTLETVNGLVIELPQSAIKSLAEEDGVQYIEPPLPKFSEVNDSNRARVGADIVQAPPYGLTGSGVTVLVYDGGTGLASHQDFGGRLTARDASGLSNHSTHVAGTVGGSGAASGGLRKGMAPGVLIESYGFEVEGGLQEGFLYTDPGDIEDDYGAAVNQHGADIANNSIGTNTANNGFPCAWEGDYGVTDTVIDAIVRGSLGAPFRVVWANGNERGSGRCGTTYQTTAPPACAKNHITVGALNSNDDSVTSFTSWGPADDGRLKPDISAPGCQAGGDGGVTSCSSTGPTAYTLFCGTSMASPTVCGLGALLLQDYRVQFPSLPDFRNSTLKTLLAHNAQDLGSAGPDYQTGFGSVRIQPTVDFMRSGNFTEQTVAHGATYSVLVVVNAGAPQLKVTLAWDDPPGTPNVSPSLVNDLDLRVFDPSNAQQFPWTLNPASPSTPAVRTQADHINNLEQVLVSTPAAGVWRVEILGFNVPQGPQPFSLCASPLLVNCSTQGVISLDRAKYACADVATLEVVDCDLNNSNGIAETVTVSIASSSEPVGESVLLIETAPETAKFQGAIPLGTTDAAGTLLIGDGDSVTATYVDADDGMGGSNVVVTDAAVVDCVPPEIMNVQATNLAPRSATVTFATDEPAIGAVHYGLSCDALSGTASAFGFNTAHSINLSGLTESSTYFVAVDAADESGNATTEDNGGLCYSFETPDIPDYFTEEFVGTGNDLDNTSLTFIPNGTFEHYDGCAALISALPTDPAGGTAVTLADDASLQVALTGGATVSLYGLSFGGFYINANGNITFTSSDSDYTESMADHFDTARVAGLFDDLDPAQGGSVSRKQLADRAAVTWQNVPEHNAGGANTLQIEMFFDGRIQVSYLAVSATDGLAGLSKGTGLPTDFFESDLSALGFCGPHAPVAAGANVSTPASTPVTITMMAEDEGLPDPPAAVTYQIVSLPAYRLRDASDNHLIVAAELPYTLAGGGNQVVYQPGAGFNGNDSFQFQASDGGIPPDGGDSNIATIDLTVGGTQAIYSFPMDANPGWTATGQWQFGQPTGGGTHDRDPAGGYSGTMVYGYNLAGDYPNSLAPVQYLTTTALDCSGVTGTQLRFQRWLGIESATYDHASIQVSSNGTSWTTVWNHTQTTALSESSWSPQSYDIAASADGQPTVYVRWGMGTTDASVSYPGWNIDDVEIWAIPPTPVAGDWDGDGDVDSADFVGFPGCMTGVNNGPADPACGAYYFDPDDDVDLADFAEFQSAATE